MITQRIFTILITGLTLVANAEDCLDRKDDRYAHEYYSDSYESNKERRRHSNDLCNDAFEQRQNVKADNKKFEEAEEKARIENEATAKRLLQLMNQ